MRELNFERPTFEPEVWLWMHDAEEVCAVNVFTAAEALKLNQGQEVLV